MAGWRSGRIGPLGSRGGRRLEVVERRADTAGRRRSMERGVEGLEEPAGFRLVATARLVARERRRLQRAHNSEPINGGPAVLTS